MNLATVQVSLGFCWAAVEGAKLGITPQTPDTETDSAPNTAGHRLDITASLYLFVVFSWQNRKCGR